METAPEVQTEPASPAPEPAAVESGESDDQALAEAVAAAEGETVEPQEAKPEAEPQEGEPEKAPEVEAKPAEPEDKAAHWDRVAEQERENRSLRDQLKASGDAITPSQLKELARENPKQLLETLGLGTDQVFDLMAGDLAGVPKADDAAPEMPDSVAELVKAWPAVQEELKASREWRASKQQDDELSRFQRAMAADPTKYEVLSDYGRDGLMYAYQTEQELKKRGHEATEAIALESVEKQLIELEESRLERLSKKVRFRDKFAQSETKVAEKSPEATPGKEPVSVGAPAGNLPMHRELTDDEWFLKAVTAAEGRD